MFMSSKSSVTLLNLNETVTAEIIFVIYCCRSREMSVNPRFLFIKRRFCFFLDVQSEDRERSQSYQPLGFACLSPPGFCLTSGRRRHPKRWVPGAPLGAAGLLFAADIWELNFLPPQDFQELWCQMLQRVGMNFRLCTPGGSRWRV